MKLNALILGSMMACCAGCTVEKTAYLTVSRNDGRNMTSVSCAARLVKAFGLDDGCFANTNQFNLKRTPKRSHAAKLARPFGPFESVVVSLTDCVPTVVNVSNADRTAVTKRSHRLWLDEIELSHDYCDKASAEGMVEDFSRVLDLLNRTLGSDLAMPQWPAVVDKNIAGARHGDRKKNPYLTENGERPKLVAAYSLADQRITLEAEDGLYGWRENETVLLVPPTIRMRIKFSVAGSGDSWAGARKYDELISESIQPVTLGDSLSEELSFGKGRSEWCGDLEWNENPDDCFPCYEYNVDTKRLKNLLR